MSPRRLLDCLLFCVSQAAFVANAQVDFRDEVASQAVIDVGNWIVSTGDNHRKPFIMVDKINAKVFVFDHFGNFFAATPALLGLTKGDTVSLGMGARTISSILPSERVTPAGRFASELDYNRNNEMVLWVDYDSGIALHPVVTTNPAEKRVQRLESLAPLDNRITFGCINVSAKFYETVVMSQFVGTTGLVYILPEMQSHSLAQVFGRGIVKFLH